MAEQSGDQAGGDGGRAVAPRIGDPVGHQGQDLARLEPHPGRLDPGSLGRQGRSGGVDPIRIRVGKQLPAPAVVADQERGAVPHPGDVHQSVGDQRGHHQGRRPAACGGLVGPLHTGYRSGVRVRDGGHADPLGGGRRAWYRPDPVGHRQDQPVVLDGPGETVVGPLTGQPVTHPDHRRRPQGAPRGAGCFGPPRRPGRPAAASQDRLGGGRRRVSAVDGSARCLGQGWAGPDVQSSSSTGMAFMLGRSGGTSCAAPS